MRRRRKEMSKRRKETRRREGEMTTREMRVTGGVKNIMRGWYAGLIVVELGLSLYQVYGQ